MRKTILFLLFCFVLLKAFAQQHIADSLETILPQVSDLRKIEILNEISRAYWLISNEKSLEYAKQALELAEKVRSRKGIADALNRMGNAEHNMYNYEAALENFKKSLKVRTEIEDYKGMIGSYNNIAVAIGVLGNDSLVLENFKKALEISIQIDDKLEIAWFSLQVGNSYTTIHEKELALKYINQGKAIYESLNHEQGMAEAAIELGRVHIDQMNFNKALEYYLNAFSVFEKLSNHRGMAIASRNIGVVYWMLEKYNLALDYFFRALESSKMVPYDILGNARTINNIGATYHVLGEKEKALEYYNQVLQIYLKIRSERDIADVTHNIGMILSDMNEFDKALETYFRSVESNKKRNSKHGLANNYNNIGELYYRIGKFDTALGYLKNSVQLATEINAKEILMENFEFQAMIYAEMENFPKALELHKKYTSLKDSIFSQQNQNRVFELQVRFEAESKLREIDLLKKNNELQELRLIRQRNQRYFFLLVAVLVLTLVFFIYNRYRFKMRLNKLLIDKNSQLEEINIRLKQSEQELLTINSTKDKFFSIIAHDLKNPFNALLSFSEMLRENIKIFRKDEIKAYVEIIHKATNNLFRLLENLLQWSSAQTGEIEYNPEIFDLNKITGNIIQVLSIHADRKGIKITNEIQENLSAYGDRNLISTVIRNLISNAIKFTRENGLIRINGVVRKNEVEISVADNGIGINQMDIDKLFRLDCNVSTIGTSEERGSGLGLILCKEFVEKNGGKIWVESEPEKGSTFKFTLPKDKKAVK